jgi:hypothetical protein
MSRQRRDRIGGWRLAFRARSGVAHGILRLWAFYEWLSLRFFIKTFEIPHAEGGLFFIQFWRFRGRPIELPDGMRVARGDRVAIIHIKNHQLAKETQNGVHLARILRRMALDLRALAVWSEMPEFPSDVKAIYGVTVISRAAPRLGFTLRERPRTLRTWLDRQFLLGLLILYHPHGVERLLEGSVRDVDPEEVWMSLGELRRRYGTGGALTSRPAAHSKAVSS